MGQKDKFTKKFSSLQDLGALKGLNSEIKFTQTTPKSYIAGKESLIRYDEVGVFGK